MILPVSFGRGLVKYHGGRHSTLPVTFRVVFVKRHDGHHSRFLATSIIVFTLVFIVDDWQAFFNGIAAGFGDGEGLSTPAVGTCLGATIRAAFVGGGLGEGASFRE
ncbi:hypothetical protein HanHA300_Chr10g0373961 [Helianthus annuus]|nr:hypothetical protein HanHA300_Chr10g0373961 [Helianthus annuus]KAJ0884909.1 hypothetical protein HanPSC8_Chr10g0439281 [Helianthus annuus]